MAGQTARPQLVLKIDVDTFRGTREGVPNLVRMLRAHQAHATFLFAMGPDHTGRAMKRALRPGFFSKVSRTSVVEHYGIKTLLYGVLLPGPDIGKEASIEMRAVQDAGFECGIHTWDHVSWQDQVRGKDDAWTQRMLRQSEFRYKQVFGVAPHTFGAAGWQMNAAAFAQHDAAGYKYVSDGRAELQENGALCDPATGPYRMAPGGAIQIPTTLPTLDELLGREIDGVTLTTSNIAAHLLQLTADPVRDHVYTLHAELEGQKLAPIFEQLLSGWRAQGYDLASMADYYDKIKALPLPQRGLSWGQVPGRSGELIVPGAVISQPT
ncbi:MAG: polysaccharide deacetylase family protein [Pseudomonadota bacterium]|nr:polysaccharide deacetylase family protein [Pseudomonadota bacterium]